MIIDRDPGDEDPSETSMWLAFEKLRILALPPPSGWRKQYDVLAGDFQRILQNLKTYR